MYIASPVSKVIVPAVTAACAVEFPQSLFYSLSVVQRGRALPFQLVVSCAAMQIKIGTDRLDTLQRSKNDVSSVALVDFCNPIIALVAFVDMASLPG